MYSTNAEQELQVDSSFIMCCSSFSIAPRRAGLPENQHSQISADIHRCCSAPQELMIGPVYPQFAERFQHWLDYLEAEYLSASTEADRIHLVLNPIQEL